MANTVLLRSVWNSLQDMQPFSLARASAPDARMLHDVLEWAEHHDLAGHSDSAMPGEAKSESAMPGEAESESAQSAANRSNEFMGTAVLLGMAVAQGSLLHMLDGCKQNVPPC